MVVYPSGHIAKMFVKINDLYSSVSPHTVQARIVTEMRSKQALN